VDPGNRRTFPWDNQDTALQDWYRQLIHLRTNQQVLQTGAEKTLLSDDANRVFAFQRRDDGGMAVVILNADAPANAHTAAIAPSW
jgi:alpha-glucosidase